MVSNDPQWPGWVAVKYFGFLAFLWGFLLTIVPLCRTLTGKVLNPPASRMRLPMVEIEGHCRFVWRQNDCRKIWIFSLPKLVCAVRRRLISAIISAGHWRFFRRWGFLDCSF